MRTVKALAAAGAIAATLLSSIGIAAAAGYADAGGHAYVNPYGQAYGAARAGYIYNNGTTSGAGHVWGASGPSRGG